MGSRLTAVVLLLASAFGVAQAQERERLYQRSVAAACAQCHGTDGVPAPGSNLRPLAGMPREELVAQLKAFKAGSRSGTIMPQLSKGYSDLQIDLLASYFSSASN